MKLSQYAKQQGISYHTALRWWQAGQMKGYQAPTGTIIVAEDEPVQKRAKSCDLCTRFFRRASDELGTASRATLAIL